MIAVTSSRVVNDGEHFAGEHFLGHRGSGMCLIGKKKFSEKSKKVETENEQKVRQVSGRSLLEIGKIEKGF